MTEKVIDLAKLVSYQEGSIVSREIIKKDTGTVTVFAFDKRQGLSQGELAKKMGISQQLISRIEKGKENFSLFTLNNISCALDQKIQIKFKGSLEK